MAVIKTVVLDMQELKGLRKDFEKVHRMTFGGNPPPPHSDDRKTPVEMFVAEVELAHDVIVDWVWRLAARKSRRLNVLLWQMERLRRATLRAFPAYADALETAATERGASNAKAIGKCLHNLPQSRRESHGGVHDGHGEELRRHGCLHVHRSARRKARTTWPLCSTGASRIRGMPTIASRSIQPRSTRGLSAAAASGGRWKLSSGQDITMDIISAYDDAISARRLRARVAAACREHGVALPESAEDMAAVVENHPYFTSLGPPRTPKYWEDGQARDVPAGGRRRSCERPMSGD